MMTHLRRYFAAIGAVIGGTIWLLLRRVRRGMAISMLLVSCLIPTPLLATDVDAGVTAYDAGDYAAALAIFRPLAEQGFADAQNNLGRMYANGEGVPKDYVMAHMWCSVARARGAEKADKALTIFELRMTKDQITDAQIMARRCAAQDYKNCDDL